MDREVFNRFRDIVHAEAGISLGEEKQSLLANRISKRLTKLGLKSEREYLEIIETDLNGLEMLQLIDAISTNVTYFWRESAHYDFYSNELKRLLLERREIKVWCAASSSGEEPFCLAAVAHMRMKEAGGGSPAKNGSVKILGTDISTKVLAIANTGLYDPKQLRDTPADLTKKYFPIRRIENEERVVVAQELRDMVTFKKLNLSRMPFPLKGNLDFIFCRNVMIYFDKALREKIVDEFTRLLRPEGFLVISHSENLMGLQHSLKSTQPGVYQRC